MFIVYASETNVASLNLIKDGFLFIYAVVTYCILFLRQFNIAKEYVSATTSAETTSSTKQGALSSLTVSEIYL